MAARFAGNHRASHDVVPMLALAGRLAAKKHVPASAGSFPTTGVLWVGLLVGIVLGATARVTLSALQVAGSVIARLPRPADALPASLWLEKR